MVLFVQSYLQTITAMCSTHVPIEFGRAYIAAKGGPETDVTPVFLSMRASWGACDLTAAIFWF